MPSAHLTDFAVKSAKARTKPYKLVDGSGLFLLVQPNGAKFWRYRYRIDKVENQFAVGEYPTMSVAAARDERSRARNLVKQGLHPSHQRKADQLVVKTAASNSFQNVASEWISQNKRFWSAYYYKQVTTVLAEDVFPHIGPLPIHSVKAAHLLTIIRRVDSRGAPTVAILIRQWASAVFRFAVSTLRAEFDPAAALKGAIKRPPVKHKKALSSAELKQLLTRLSVTRSTKQVELALGLLALTFVRPGELRCAMWSEFDLDLAEWRIPGERMKMREPHIVPLSRQAVVILRKLLELTGGHSQLFPNNRDNARFMSPTTLNRCLERMGFNGIFSAHGFRATASTQLNELGFQSDVIERQLAHRERNSVRASYNHARYLPQRRILVQAWADWIDSQVMGDGNVTPLRTKRSVPKRGGIDHVRVGAARR